jgi:hypothetical protein
MVNTDFTVFSKTGAVLRGATPINQLWANTDGECKTHNDGDPVVVYDQLAKRWLLSQFIVAGADEQYGECIAVSTTSDATGAYYYYRRTSSGSATSRLRPSMTTRSSASGPTATTCRATSSRTGS